MMKRSLKLIWVRRLLLEIKDLCAGYGPMIVLKDVSMSIDRGEFVALIGPNGAGKTTLLRCITGLIKITKGFIKFKGEMINDLPPNKIAEKGIAIVPEGRRLFPKLTVLENLQMGAYSNRAREREKETLEEVFQLFPRLKERKNQKAGTLSGGEQQMLAIGRALMSIPELLLLDEPSLGLAPLLVSELFKKLEVLKERRLTILLVEQNVYRALQLADRAYLMENGRIVQEGPSEMLLKDDRIRKTYLGVA
jgi:branched-chain amino acid transport system ATP-binding protein